MIGRCDADLRGGLVQQRRILAHVRAAARRTSTAGSPGRSCGKRQRIELNRRAVVVGRAGNPRKSRADCALARADCAGSASLRAWLAGWLAAAARRRAKRRRPLTRRCVMSSCRCCETGDVFGRRDLGAQGGLGDRRGDDVGREAQIARLEGEPLVFGLGVAALRPGGGCRRTHRAYTTRSRWRCSTCSRYEPAARQAECGQRALLALRFVGAGDARVQSCRAARRRSRSPAARPPARPRASGCWRARARSAH